MPKPPSRFAPALLLPLLSLVLACDGSSPTAVSGAPSSVTVVFEASEALVPYRDLIFGLVDDTAHRAEPLINLGSLVVHVGADPARTIPGWGMGGYTLGPHDVEIVLDPAAAGLGELLPARLPPVAAHEMHHAVRWRGPGPYRTLLEALVFEGLADHFAVELLGSPVPPWAQALSEADIERTMRQARAELDEPVRFAEWFFGAGGEFPRWTGYTLGFRLVGDYLARHPDRSAADLVHAPAEAFRPD